MCLLEQLLNKLPPKEQESPCRKAEFRCFLVVLLGG